MAVTALNERTFPELIEKKEGIVLIDFWAPWCGPCRVFGPVFEKSAEKHPEITFAKVDTQQERGLAEMLQIQSIPTLMVLRDGIMVYREAGALPAASLEKLIQEVQDLDMTEVRAKFEEAVAKLEAERGEANSD